MMLQPRKKHIIDPELLVAGDEFKNYKELCERLNLPTTGGNDKKKFFEELERYCKYEKSEKGHNIKIIEIYDDPIEDDPSFKTLITENLCSLFVKHYQRTGDTTLNITFRNLITDLYFVNHNYKDMSFVPEQLSKILQLDDKDPVVKEFFDFVNMITRYYTNTAVKTLEDLKLIKMYKRTWVFKDYKWQPADDVEKQIVLQKEKEALDILVKKYPELPLDGISSLIKHGIVIEFFDLYEILLEKDEDVEFTRSAEFYEFIFLEYIEKYYREHRLPEDRFLDLNSRFCKYLSKHTEKIQRKLLSIDPSLDACSKGGFKKLLPYKETYAVNTEKIKKHVVERDK